ncbi:MAG: hypothetical protein L6U99_08970 [Clostridium sp.]|nr:MAG: hypothetical protein L6U99_08970 [Clostridium sp.]
MKKTIIHIFLLLPLLFLNINIKASSNNVGIVSTNGSSLNIRQEASTSAKIVYKVPNKKLYFFNFQTKMIGTR